MNVKRENSGDKPFQICNGRGKLYWGYETGDTIPIFLFFFSKRHHHPIFCGLRTTTDLEMLPRRIFLACPSALPDHQLLTH